MTTADHIEMHEGRPCRWSDGVMVPVDVAGPMPVFIEPLRQKIRQKIKTQTRRIIAAPKQTTLYGRKPVWASAWVDGDPVKESGFSPGGQYVHLPYGGGDYGAEVEAVSTRVFSPYNVGDIRYLREPLFRMGTCWVAYADDSMHALDTEGSSVPWRWKRNRLPQIHMPAAYARTFCRITQVRAERVQDITEADAMAEGVDDDAWDQCPVTRDYSGDNKWFQMWDEDQPGYCDMEHLYRRSFQSLWDSINADREGGIPWRDNPMVWVYGFEVVT